MNPTSRSDSVEPEHLRRYFRALVVDDESILRTVAHHKLINLGYLSMPTDSDQALTELDRGGFDLVLLGCGSNLEQSLCSAQSLRVEGTPSADLPWVIVGEPAWRDAFVNAGFAGYVSRPVSTEALASTLDPLLIAEGAPPPLSETVIEQIRMIPDRPGNTFDGLIEAFLDGSREHLRAVEQGLRDHDRQIILAAAHGLRGASAMIGALPLFKLSAQIDQAASLQPEICEDLLQSASKELDRVEDFLRSRMG